MSKPRVLVLGGVGFIGRNFVTYLIENDLASKVRVVDKVIPKTALLTPRQQAAFDKAEFLQKNLVNPGQDLDLFSLLFSFSFFFLSIFHFSKFYLFFCSWQLRSLRLLRMLRESTTWFSTWQLRPSTPRRKRFAHL